MLWALSLSGGFYPAVGGDEGFVDRLEQAADGDGSARWSGSRCGRSNDRRRRREAARRAGTGTAPD